MTFDEWFKQYCKEEGITQLTGVDKVDMRNCWNAAQEEANKEKINECNALLEELYPLRVYEVNTRQTNKEQTNENR